MALVEMWIVMDADEQYAVGADREEAVEKFEEQIGSAAGARIAKVNVDMAPPVVAEVDVEIEDDAGEIVEASAEGEEAETEAEAA